MHHRIPPIEGIKSKTPAVTNHFIMYMLVITVKDTKLPLIDKWCFLSNMPSVVLICSVNKYRNGVHYRTVCVIGKRSHCHVNPLLN